MASRRKKYPYPLVEVYWTDAETDSGWEHPGEKNPTVPLVVTVGFLVNETDQLVSIASTTGEDRAHNSRIQIPKGMIKEMRILKATISHSSS